MTNIAIWIIGILLSIIGVLLGRLLIKFDKLIEAQNQTNSILVAHDERLDNIDKRFNGSEKRLSNHAERIRSLEIETARKHN